MGSVSNLAAKCLLSSLLQGNGCDYIRILTVQITEGPFHIQRTEMVVKILDGLLGDVVFGSHSLGYYYYSLIVKELVESAVDIMFVALHQSLSTSLKCYFDGHPELVPVIEICLQAMFKILSFPFDNTYVSYSTDCDLSNICQVNYPYRWSKFLTSAPFLQSIVRFLLQHGLPVQLQVESLRLLSVISSGRRDPGLSDTVISDFKTIMLTLSHQVLQTYEGQRKPVPSRVLEQLIDQAARLIKVWNLSELDKLDNNSLGTFLSAYRQCTMQIFQRETDVAYSDDVRFVAGHTGTP